METQVNMDFLKKLAQHAKNNGSKVAVVDNDGTRETTYAELDAMSDLVAQKLRDSGVPEGSAVLVNMGRCREYVIAEIGILKAGCAFVPVVPEHPQERTEYIQKDCKAVAVMDKPDFNVTVLSSEQSNLPADTAFIVYTSGSTGRPKGVVWSRTSFDKLAEGAEEYQGLRNIIQAQMSPFSFVGSVAGCAVIFHMCATMHILSKKIVTDMRAFENYYADNKITVGFMPPKIMAQYKNRDKYLERVFTGSEKVTNIYSEGYKIFNRYGQSEALGLAIFQIDKPYDNTPIGKAFSYCELHLLDEHGEEVSHGEEGEICVIGNYASCYLNLPEETARTFEKLPDGRIRIHTGDIGRMLPDGNLLYVNRKDWMVKINGQRVDPGEVEVAMSKIEGIIAVAVKDFVGSAGQVYLVGFYTGEELDSDFIRAELAKVLPEYMIPTGFVHLEKFPINQNGKLDKLALVVPEDFGRAEYVAPTTELEAKVCRGFEEVLKLERVGISDDFYLLGGSSIDAMKLQNHLSISGLTVKTIFDGRSPQRIARIVRDTSGEDLLQKVTDETCECYPLNTVQSGTYILSVLNMGKCIFNLPAIMDFNQTFDADRFKTALLKVLNNHDVFKAKIVTQNGSPYFIQNNQIPVTVPVKELPYAQLKMYAQEFIRPFNLNSDDALYRAEIIKTEKGFTLLFDIHHIITDGISNAILLREIREAYEERELEPEIISSLKLGLLENEIKKTAAYKQAQEKFCRLYSDNPERTKLKENEESSLGPSTDAFSLSVSGEAREAIDKYIASNHFTEQTFFAAAFEYALAGFLNKRDVEFYIETHGRHDARLKNSVGFFVQQSLLYGHIDEEDSVRDFVNHTGKELNELINTRFCPSMELSDRYDLNDSIHFVYHADLICNNQDFGNNICGEIKSSRYNGIKLKIDCHKTGEEYIFSFNYRKDLYKKYVLLELANMYLDVIREFTQKEYLKEVRICTVEDAYSKASASHKSFLNELARHALINGSRTAVVDNDGTRNTTCAELDAMSDLVAQKLRDSGVPEGSAVLVNMGRCREYIIAEIGILKADCAIVPVVPEYPQERMDYIIKDCRAAAVIDNSDFNVTILHEGKSNIPEDTAFIIYTSGSTGRPKGVVWTREMFAKCVEFDYFNTESKEVRIAALAPYTFIAALGDLIMSLYHNHTMHILSGKIAKDIHLLEEYYAHHKITHGFIPVKLLERYRNRDEALQMVFTGGEKVAGIYSDEYVICNAYGQSEAVYVTMFKTDKVYDNTPIGKPLAGTEVVILDDNGREVPQGEEGEICVMGNIAAGYLNLPEETAITFEKMSDGRRRLHTGDIGKMLPDGNFVYINRKDWMVKINGQRVDLGEVEAAMSKITGISAVAVKDFANSAGSIYLVGFYVGEELDAEFIRAELTKTLPEYMIPSGFVRLGKLPLNENGKLDKPALAVPEDFGRAEYIAPTNEIEEKLCNAFAEILNVERIGINDDFYELGGDSLRSTEVIARVDLDFLTAEDLLKGRTPKKIAAIYMENEKNAQGGSWEETEFDSRRGSYALLGVEKKYVEEIMREKGRIGANLSRVVSFPLILGAEKIADAMNTMIHNRPIWGTVYYYDENSELMQRYDESKLPHVEVERMSEVEFDSIKGSLLPVFEPIDSIMAVARVIETEAKIYVLMGMSHAKVDGFGERLFWTDIFDAYQGKELPLDSYYSCLAEIMRNRDSERYNDARAYFDERYGKTEWLRTLPPDQKGGDLTRAFNIEPLSFSVSDIEAAEKRLGASRNAVFAAITLVTLAKVTGNTKVMLNWTYQDRSGKMKENAGGLMMKRLPIAIDVMSMADFGECLEKIKEQIIDGMSNSSYEWICENENGLNDDVMSFVYQPISIIGTEKLKAAGGELLRDVIPNPGTGRKFAVMVIEHEKGILGTVNYMKGYYSEKIIKKFHNAFAKVANKVIIDEKSGNFTAIDIEVI